MRREVTSEVATYEPGRQLVSVDYGRRPSAETGVGTALTLFGALLRCRETLPYLITLKVRDIEQALGEREDHESSHLPRCRWYRQRVLLCRIARKF